MISFHFREAQCDVDQVLVDLKQPRHSKALYVRAEAMYNLGNFEYALMNFHRAKKKCRPKVILLCHRCLQKKILSFLNRIGMTLTKVFLDVNWLLKTP